MNITINMPPGSEVLEAEELIQITGRMQSRHQIDWLRENGWKYFVTAQGAPVVGRLYARMVMAGVDPSSVSIKATSVQY